MDKENNIFRETFNLTGFWGVKVDPEEQGEKEGYNLGFKPNAKLYVPGCWNTQDWDYYYYEGMMWYKRDISMPKRFKGKRIFIQFDGANYYTKVWIDGKFIGEHEGGFTPFEFEITDKVTIGNNLLSVMVENNRRSDRIPGELIDWYNYGGLHRPVRISARPPTYIQDVWITTRKRRNGKWLMTAKVKIDNFQQGMTLMSTLESNGIHAKKMPICGDETVLEMEIENPEIWRLLEGNLSSLRLELMIKEEVVDSAEDRFGFRTIEIRGTQLYINGEIIFMTGVLRHEDHPVFGRSLPQWVSLKDLKIMMNANINTCRAIHYPVTEDVLDLADELGLLFSEEIPIFGFNPEQLENPEIVLKAEKMLKEMIARDKNHPSVICWCVQNESATDTIQGRDFVQNMINITRDTDSTRLITSVSNRRDKDLCYNLVDVICVNLYFGWYSENIYALDSMLERIHSMHPNKPIILSEYGASALPGFRSFEYAKWSEDYQASLIHKATEIAASKPYLIGMWLQHFMDYRVDPERWNYRPREFNNKGIVTEHRQPKLAYKIVKDVFGRILDKKKLVRPETKIKQPFKAPLERKEA